ncbi:VanZ family protein [Bacillus pseudomycoides]
MWIIYFSFFCIHKLFFHFYTVYRIVDKFIPQGIDFVDNFLKFIAIAIFF